MPSELGPGSRTQLVARFGGKGCWQQHLHIFNAMAKWNGWMDETAALQLFAHLEGEALNVALLMTEGERANRKGLSQGLSNYYNSPGRCQPEGTFAGSLELLQLTGKVDGVLKKILDCNQPGRGGPRHLRHRTRQFGGPGIWGYGYTRPEPDGLGQVHCGPT